MKKTSKRNNSLMRSRSSQILIDRRDFLKQITAATAGVVATPAMAALIEETVHAQPAHNGQSIESQAAIDSLLSGFKNPHAAARPRVWWHWMNGNVTWDGAKKDWTG